MTRVGKSFAIFLWMLSIVHAQTPSHVVRGLDEFGPTTAPNEIQATFSTAVAELRKTGGVLALPAAAWKQLQGKHGPLQGLSRIPEPPGETKTWHEGPGVTVLTHNEDSVIVQVPPMTGLRIERRLRLADGDSLPHWGTHPMLTLDSQLVYGSTSYLDWLQEPVQKGQDRRFYVPTVRGLHPGQFLNIHGGPDYGGGVTRAYVKSVGFDPQKRLHYVVADSDLDHLAGAILHNKSNTGLIHMLQTSHNDNQTYDVKVIRNQFAHGDTYIYYCDFNYMSNVHSAAGDENGNCFAAFIRSEENNFRGVVESMDWTTARLTFSASSQNVQTLGDSRPLINLNPGKHISAGKVLIVTGRSEFDSPNKAMSTLNGQDYATGLVTSPITKHQERKFGGLIRGDKDAPWTPDIVGRFFAVTEPTEKTPKGSLRWYLITDFHANPDGTKDIEIQRFWWGAKSAGSPTLYRTENYTWDNHIRPLSYVIAPGAYVNDVSRAVPGGDRGGQRTLGLAPHSAMSTPLDFANGDAVEQAIGPDPWKPQPMRVWMWEDVPGQWPSAVFDIANWGAASRYAVLSVHGGPESLEETAQRHEQKPAWDNILVMNAAATVGLNLKADFAKAAILFQQPHKEQSIQWHYDHKPDSAPKTASLTVSKTTGELTFQGGGIRTNGSITAVGGLSATDTPAKNLRGKNVVVPSASTSIRITFAQPEADGDYAVFIEQSWLTNRAISNKGENGFTVSFDKPAPEGSTIDWMLVR